MCDVSGPQTYLSVEDYLLFEHVSFCTKGLDPPEGRIAKRLCRCVDPGPRSKVTETLWYVVSSASELELSGGVKRLFGWEKWGAVGGGTFWELGKEAPTTPIGLRGACLGLPMGTG